MKNSKGFTLVELLAVIIILAIVASITIAVAINIIRDSKNTSYQVTITNIENSAVNYAKEYQVKYKKASATSEYYCVSVQELVDYGYLKPSVVEAKITDSKNVKLTDKIYVGRNISSKVVTTKKFCDSKTGSCASC